MTARRRLALGLATALVAALAGASASPAAVTVTPNRQQTSIKLGDGFSFGSRITNTGPATLSHLVAHLNVVSLRDGVYVDPEDWSPRRTQYLAPLAPGASVHLRWSVTAVNGGRFAVYVAILPAGATSTPRGGLAIGPGIDLRVAERRTLNSGGVVPLVLGIPALLALAMVALRRARQHA
jgi:hypothetical protein